MYCCLYFMKMLFHVSSCHNKRGIAMQDMKQEGQYSVLSTIVSNLERHKYLSLSNVTHFKIIIKIT